MWALEATVAEFMALRQEIAYRSQMQHLLINLNVVSAGTLAGIALTRATDAALLLLLPAASSALGLLYADHARSIAYLATYIDQELRAPDGTRPFRWERCSHEYDADRPLLFKFPLSLFLVFVGPPVLALIFVPFDVKDFWSAPERIAGWSIGAALTTLMAVTVLKTPLKAERETDQSDRNVAPPST